MGRNKKRSVRFPIFIPIGVKFEVTLMDKYVPREQVVVPGIAFVDFILYLWVICMELVNHSDITSHSNPIQNNGDGAVGEVWG